MGSKSPRRLVKTAEVLVLGIVLAILAVVLNQVRLGIEEDRNRKLCMDNVRQLATAVQMYVQDNNNRFPGTISGMGKGPNDPAWEDALLEYVGSKSTFRCPADPLAEKMTAPVSYGYSGLLVRLDGSGLNEGNRAAPVNVGAICDVASTREWGYGGLVVGGAWGDENSTVWPVSRHTGVVIGYCDGHVEFQTGGYNLKNLRDKVSHAFFQAVALQLLDNPAGGLNRVELPDHPDLAEITIGGDYCLYPLLTAAAEVWKNGHNVQYYSRGFMGQGYTTGRPVAKKTPEMMKGYWSYGSGIVGPWVWGFGNDTDPFDGEAFPIAKDCVVIIVAKNSKIKHPVTGQLFLGDPARSPLKNEAYVCTTADINVFFTASKWNTGFSAHAWQVYTYNIDSGTRKFFARKMGLSPLGVPGDHDLNTGYRDAISEICRDRWPQTPRWERGNSPGPTRKVYPKRPMEAVNIENDQDMVDKVAADPYGIGYCSSIFADLERVQILALKDPATGEEYYYPNADPAHRWEVGEDAPTPAQWPLARTLYAVVGGKAEKGGKYTTFADFFLKPGSKGRTCLLRGPLFTVSYWRLGANDK
ncbi:MAG: hypothetical protein ACYC7E_08030 [Armatimonadota bacterium]